ncbi:putative bone marrow stromal cell-derived ubiquitin-like protein [Operophtera brumata]|uniref:Putative bone marrow stromal cell-derived ubiquitin-like protein n=1 Tax=Operophtera brumata TaxID=104452 RepID=A0A0L7L9A2_OPEBR|nr:putative bone marrow stromal cell-derived ubiquitin-like protein [Operophtera brumata]
MEVQSCIFLGIKVKPGPIERFKLENYTLDNTVDNLKTEAEKKTNLPSSSLGILQLMEHTIKQLNKSTLITNKEQFCLDLKNSFDLLNTLSYEDPQTQYSHILKSIKTAIQNFKLDKSKTNKLSNYNSKLLLEERLKFTIYTPEFKTKDIEVKRSIRRDIRNANVESVKLALEKNTSLKIAMRGIQSGKTSITGMKDSNGIKQGDKGKILDICTQFYKNLYSDTTSTHNTSGTYSCSAATLQDSGVKNGEMVHVLLNEEPVISEIIEQAPSLGEDCVALSILHEVELLAALGANVQTMRRGADAHRELPVALRHLTQLQAATEAVSATTSSAASFRRLLRDPTGESNRTPPASGGSRGVSLAPLITPEMFSEAISDAMSRASARNPAGTPMEQSTEAVSAGVAASSSQSAPRDEDYSSQLSHMHEMGLLDDALNVRALLIFAAVSAGVAASSSQSAPRDEDYSSQLSHMHEMGLLDDALNVRALLICAAVSAGVAASSSQSAPRDEDYSSQLSHMHEMGLLDDALNVRALLICAAVSAGVAASSSQSAPRDEDYSSPLSHMHEMGLLDDALNVRALLICAGDVNVAINLVFSGAIGDE